jgi:hypothetical protein
MFVHLLVDLGINLITHQAAYYHRKKNDGYGYDRYYRKYDARRNALEFHKYPSIRVSAPAGFMVWLYKVIIVLNPLSVWDQFILNKPRILSA